MPDLDSWPSMPRDVNVSFESCGISGETPTTLTSGAINTFGSWVQLLASSAKTAIALIGEVSGNLYGSAYHRLQFGVGAALSEVAALDLIAYPYSGAVHGGLFGTRLALIPAGSRIAARYACSAASKSAYVVAHLIERADG